MNINGIQKLTLLDFPGKVACTIFAGGCNLRCPFCHNASLVLPERMEKKIPTDEILSFLKKRQGVLDGVCLTGGEPLLNKDAGEFLSEVKSLGYSVKLDTNGFFPDRLKELVLAGIIDYVAMDIKNSKEKYASTCGTKNLDFAPAKASIDFLLSGKIPYEFRTTAVKEFHDSDSFSGIAELISGAENYFIQSYVQSDNIIGTGFSAFKKEELESFADIVRPYVKNISLRGI